MRTPDQDMAPVVVVSSLFALFIYISDMQSCTVTEEGSTTFERDWPLSGRDRLEREQEEISWSCLGIHSRNMKSLIYVNICITSHLDNYIVSV